MTTKSIKQKTTDLRKRFSIEMCDNFTQRLDPSQSREIKLGALIAIRNFIKEARINDPILFSFLVDTIADPDKKVRDMVFKVVREVVNHEIVELIEIKLKELNGEFKKEIETGLTSSFLKDSSTKL